MRLQSGLVQILLMVQTLEIWGCNALQSQSPDTEFKNANSHVKLALPCLEYLTQEYRPAISLNLAGHLKKIAERLNLHSFGCSMRRRKHQQKLKRRQ